MSTPAASASVREYWCFISYRHADNKEPGRQWASWLHQALETYEVPADLVGTRNQRGDLIPERIFPVFRDEEELPADARLSTPIEAALQRSRFLVVLCSPQSVQSRFVADEVLRFKQLGKQDRILAAILEGTPTRGADPVRECFPEPLRFALGDDGQLSKLEVEPIAADFRLPDGTPGWTSPKAHRDALRVAGVPEGRASQEVADYAKRQNLMLLKIVAGVLGVPLGVLTERDKAYQLEKQRQRSQVLRRWLAAVSLLAVAALVSGVLALQNAREAAAQRDRVAAKSKELSDTLGISYFREGSARLRDERTAREGVAYLARAVREHGHAASADRLLTLFQQREFWIAERGEPRTLPLASPPPPVPLPPGLEPLSAQKEPGKFDLVVKGPNGETAVSWCEDVDSPQGSNHPGTGLHHFRVWDAAGKPVGPWIQPDFEADHWVGNIRRLSFSPDGIWMAVTVERWRQPEYLQVWDIRRGQQVGETIEATGENPNYQGAHFNLVSFAPVQQPGSMKRWPLLVSTSRGDVYWLEVLQSAEGTDAPFLNEVSVVSHRASVRTAQLLPGERPVLISASDDGEIRFTRPGGNRSGPGLPSLHLDKPLDAVVPQGDGEALLAVDGRQLRARAIPPFQPGLIAPEVGALTAEVDEEHTVRCFPPGKPDQIVFQMKFAETIAEARAQAEPPALTVADADGTVRLFRMGKGQAQLLATGRDREVTVDPGGEARRVSLPGPVADLRLAGGDGPVIATTADYVYQVIGSGVSKSMDEKILFRTDEVPSACDTTLLSRSGRVLLSRSQHWEPPNAMLSWTMLWDCGSGEPLSDRIRFIDDGMQEIAFNRAPFLDDRKANVEGMLLYDATPGMEAVLADLAEALAGQQLDAAGELQPVEQSHGRAIGLMQRLAELAGKPGP